MIIRDYEQFDIILWRNVCGKIDKQFFRQKTSADIMTDFTGNECKNCIVYTKERLDESIEMPFSKFERQKGVVKCSVDLRKVAC